MPVALTNRTRRLVAYALPHDICCTATGHCGCIAVHEGASPVAASLTLCAGETRDGLSPAVVRVPSIARAIRRGQLAATVVSDGTPIREESARRKRRSPTNEGDAR